MIKKPAQVKKGISMAFSPQKQNILHAGILLIIAVICFALYPKHASKVHGIYLPNSTSLAAIAPESVTLLSQSPASGKVLGHIRAIKHFSNVSGKKTEQNVLDIEEFSKRLAAKNGANAIYVNRIGRTLFEGPLDGYQIEVTALHIA